jgi:hypothetical protein
MDHDEDRIKQALARRSVQERGAASARASDAAEQKRELEHAQETARQFATSVADVVRKTVDSLNRGALPEAGYSVAIAATSVSRNSMQAPSLLYALKTSAGAVSAEMLVFKHVGDSVLIETGPNPHYHGVRVRRSSQSFKPRAASIAEFTPAIAEKAFAEFVEVVLPTFPV